MQLCPNNDVATTHASDTVVDCFRRAFDPDHTRRYLRDLAIEPTPSYQRDVKQAIADKYVNSPKNKSMWQQLERSQLLPIMPAATTNTRKNRYRVHTIQDRRQKLSLIMFDADLHFESDETRNDYENQIAALKTIDVFWTASPGRWLENEPSTFNDEETDPAKLPKRGSRQQQMRIEGETILWDHFYLTTSGDWKQYQIQRTYQQGIHAFLVCTPVDRKKAADLLDEWFAKNGVNMETSLDTRGILIPGQDKYCLPCEPGLPHKPVCETLDETMSLFVDYFDSHQHTPLHEALGLAKEASTSTKISSVVSAKKVAHKPTQPVSRNRIRAGEKFDIPGVSGPISFSKNSSGNLNPKIYYTIEDCQEDPNGFNISNAFISRIFREQRGDAEATFQIADQYRQQLRTAGSAKNKDGLRRTHIRSFVSYLSRTYDPSKTKEGSPQALQDQKTIARHKSIPRSYVIRALRDAVNQNPEMDVHFRRDLFSFLLDHDKWQRRFNGRIAARCSKTFKRNPRNKAMQDFRACRGSRRRCNFLKKHTVKLGLLVITDGHSWSNAKCAGYDLGESILAKAEELHALDLVARKRDVERSAKAADALACNTKKETKQRQEEKPSSAKIRVHGESTQSIAARLSDLFDETDDCDCPDWINEPWFYPATA
jgi:hypothetical protein